VWKSRSPAKRAKAAQGPLTKTTPETMQWVAQLWGWRPAGCLSPSWVARGLCCGEDILKRITINLLRDHMPYIARPPIFVRGEPVSGLRSRPKTTRPWSPLHRRGNPKPCHSTQRRTAASIARVDHAAPASGARPSQLAAAPAQQPTQPTGGAAPPCASNPAEPCPRPAPALPAPPPPRERSWNRSCRRRCRRRRRRRHDAGAGLRRRPPHPSCRGRPQASP
jgi:hypothetical protein